MRVVIWRRAHSILSAIAGLAGAGLVILLAVALAFARGGSGGSSVGPDHTGTLAIAPTPNLASAVPSRAPGATETLPPTPTPTCDVTRPDKPFVPPKPFPATPPGYYEATWYGSAHLWTMINDGGEIWGPWLFASPPGLPQKTFWWSADWVPREELEPAITVVGRRLDAPGSFSYGNPGTNATADFGTAMLVGIDIPAYGCWELTARYREASLSYVVSVINP
jgi:hypothetical protein